MKSERNKAYKKSQTIKNKPDNKELTLLLSMVKENNIKLNKIDEDINSNPFTKLFKVKGKTFWKYFVVLTLTIVLMVCIYILWINWIYNRQFNLANSLEILGNGFYWIVAGTCYFMIEFLYAKRGLKYAKRGNKEKI